MRGERNKRVEARRDRFSKSKKARKDERKGAFQLRGIQLDWGSTYREKL